MKRIVKNLLSAYLCDITWSKVWLSAFADFSAIYVVVHNEIKKGMESHLTFIILLYPKVFEILKQKDKIWTFYKYQ